MQYKNLEEMIQKEYKLSKDIVQAEAYGDKEKLSWWEGRLDAWKWCMEQLKREDKIDDGTKEYSVIYENKTTLEKLSEYGVVTYKSPVIDMVILQSLYTKEFLISLDGVLKIGDTVEGKLL